MNESNKVESAVWATVPCDSYRVSLTRLVNKHGGVRENWTCDNACDFVDELVQVMSEVLCESI